MSKKLALPLHFPLEASGDNCKCKLGIPTAQPLRLLEGIDFEWLGNKITGFVPCRQLEQGTQEKASSRHARNACGSGCRHQETVRKPGGKLSPRSSNCDFASSGLRAGTAFAGARDCNRIGGCRCLHAKFGPNPLPAPCHRHLTQVDIDTILGPMLSKMDKTGEASGPYLIAAGLRCNHSLLKLLAQKKGWRWGGGEAPA